MYKRFLLIFPAIAGMNLALAQTDLPTTAINIFKNGTYFVVKEGKVDADVNGTRIMVPNSPLLATFWLTTTKEFDIERVDFRTDIIKTKRDVRNMFELLQTNKGKKVKITYNLGKDATTVKGTIEGYMVQGGLLRLKTAEGANIYINSNQILELVIEETPVEKIEMDSVARIGSIFFSKGKTGIPLRLTYMHTGFNWIPSYNIRLIDDKTLQIEMKALIENYAEEIKNAEVTLTIGGANFKFGTQPDPIATNYVTSVIGQYNRQVQSNSQYQWAYSNVAVTDAAVSGAENVVNYDYNTSYTTEGDKSNDLYFYKLGKVSIPMNTKSLFNIYSVTVPFEDNYEVNIPDVTNYVYTRTCNTNEEKLFDVFHSLKITNSTSTPFTTAPVFVQDKNLQPLAQDRIAYTPAGGKVQVQLSKAIDIRVNNIEAEVKVDENAKTQNKLVYKKVTIKGTVRVENLQPKSGKITVTKSIVGKITEVSDSGTILKPGTYNGLNPTSSAEWVINMGANDKKSVTYVYEVYVR
jgi:hypothetical protein